MASYKLSKCYLVMDCEVHLLLSSKHRVLKGPQVSQEPQVTLDLKERRLLSYID